MHYIVGDVQGCCDAFDRLLAEIGFSPSRDHVVVLGDLINRGPQNIATLRRLRGALTPKGTLVIAGGETDGRWLGGSDRQVRATLLSPFVGQKLGTFICSENASDLTVLRELIESGAVTAAVDRSYPLGEVPEAIRYMLDGHARGKIVITV